MDSTYRPQSPDLSSYAPQSPDLSGLRPQSPDLSGIPPSFAHFNPPHARFPPAVGSNNGFGGPYSYSPTSVPLQQQRPPPPPPSQNFYPTQYGMPSRRYKVEDGGDDNDFLPDAAESTSRSKRVKHEMVHSDIPAWSGKVEPNNPDPTLGCTLKTSFPVARIKRIMQADEDIGKVAQVTPTVVSRALELFMIQLISAAAHQARGTEPGGGGGKGPKRVLVQHLKNAVSADKNLDFLVDMVAKVPDAPTKGKKEVRSDSDDAKPKKRGKKRKDSGDDF